MVDFPAVGYITDDARTEAEVKIALEAWLAATRQLPGGQAESTLAIASGAVTPTRGVHAIDTEGMASSDDLDTIAQANLPDGSILWLHAADNARVPTVRHNQGGAGKVLLSDAANLALSNTSIWLALERTGTSWTEIGRFYGSALAAFRAYLGIGKQVLAKGSNYTVVAGDRSKIVLCTAGLTLSLTAAATLGDGFEFEIINASASGSVIIDPDGAEQVDGQTTLTLLAGESALLRCTGSAWRTVSRTYRSAAQDEAAWTDLASAGTVDIGAASSRNLRITGSTTITSFGTAPSGVTRRLRFAGALTLAHSATSLILPGGASIQAAANDTAVFASLGSGNWLCIDYKRQSGQAVSGLTLVAGTSLVLNPLSSGAPAVSQAHGLGAVPQLVLGELECLIADIGYSPGDRLDFQNLISDSNNNRGLTVLKSSTVLAIYLSTTDFLAVNKSTGAPGAFTGSRWKLTLTPYRIA